MPFRKWTGAQKAEAIALADVVGVDEAARQLGADPRSIHDWRKAAGKRPEIDVPATTWRTLHELALAKVAAALTSGKVNPTQAATIAAIAQRNAEKPPAASDPGAEEYRAFSEAIDAAFGARADTALHVLILSLDDDSRRLESGRDPVVPLGHEIEWLQSLDFDEWERQREEHWAAIERDNARVKRGWETNMTVMFEVSKQKHATLEDKRRALIAAADELVNGQNEEVRAVLAAAEAFLAENPA